MIDPKWAADQMEDRDRELARLRAERDEAVGLLREAVTVQWEEYHADDGVAFRIHAFLARARQAKAQNGEG